MSEELKPRVVNINPDEVSGIGWHPDPKLKNCPYCPTGKGIIVIRGEEDWVMCNNDNCNNAAVIPVDKWNTRPIEDALTAERDALRKLLNTAKHALLSYQYGNSSPELAEEIVAEIERIENAEANR